MEIGIDIVSILRIRKILDKHADVFLKKFLSSEEIALTKYNPQTIAGFWAAKEACSKALGVGIGKHLSFLDIQLTKNHNNAPLITLINNKMEYFKIQNLKVSITHETEFAIAVVIAQ